MIDIIVPNTISIGPIEFHLYGALLGMSFTIIYLEVEKRYKEKVSLLASGISLLVTVIGARLIFVLHNLDRFTESPLEIFNVTDGGLAYFGAALGAFISFYLISKWRQIKFYKLTDTVLLVAPLAQAVGRLGNFINQELYGLPTKLPWGIYIEPENRLAGYENSQYFHPTFLYEIILNIGSYFILKRFATKKKQGWTTGIYLFNYGVIRLLLNRIRIDKEYLWLNSQAFWRIETSDLSSILFILIGVLILYKLNTRDKTTT